MLPFSDWSISIQFSFLRVFSYKDGRMRKLVVRFVPEQTKNDPFLDQFLAILVDLNFNFPQGSLPPDPQVGSHLRFRISPPLKNPLHCPR